MAHRAGFVGRMGPPSSGGSVISYNSKAVWLGDSITSAGGNQQKSIPIWTNYFLNGLLVHDVGFNQGVGGDTTAMMIARQATGLAMNPVFFNLLAGTNDIVGDGLPSSTIIANLTTLIENAEATASIGLIAVHTILNRSDASYLSNPDFATVRTEVNNWIRSLNRLKVVVVDHDASAFDPVTDTSDGLHPNESGVILIAETTANTIIPRISYTDVLLDTTGNLLLNPELTGTAGGMTGATGQVATNWQVRNFITGVTAVCSKGTDALGNATQIITLNGTSTVSGYVHTRNVATYSGSTGEGYELLFKAEVTGGTNLGAISTSCDGVLAFGGNSVSFPINRNLTGVIRPGRSTLAAPDISNTFDCNFFVASGVTLTDMVLTVSRPIWRLV